MLQPEDLISTTTDALDDPSRSPNLQEGKPNQAVNASRGPAVAISATATAIASSSTLLNGLVLPAASIKVRAVAKPISTPSSSTPSIFSNFAKTSPWLSSIASSATISSLASALSDSLGHRPSPTLLAFDPLLDVEINTFGKDIFPCLLRTTNESEVIELDRVLVVSDSQIVELCPIAGLIHGRVTSIYELTELSTIKIVKCKDEKLTEFSDVKLIYKSGKYFDYRLKSASLLCNLIKQKMAEKGYDNTSGSGKSNKGLVTAEDYVRQVDVLIKEFDDRHFAGKALTTMEEDQKTAVKMISRVMDALRLLTEQIANDKSSSDIYDTSVNHIRSFLCRDDVIKVLDDYNSRKDLDKHDALCNSAIDIRCGRSSDNSKFTLGEKDKIEEPVNKNDDIDIDKDIGVDVDEVVDIGLDVNSDINKLIRAFVIDDSTNEGEDSYITTEELIHSNNNSNNISSSDGNSNSNNSNNDNESAVASINKIRSLMESKSFIDE